MISRHVVFACFEWDTGLLIGQRSAVLNYMVMKSHPDFGSRKHPI